MADFIDNHTYCACGEKVFPGQYHACEDLGPYTIPLGKYWCKWCKTFAQPVAGTILY